VSDQHRAGSRSGTPDDVLYFHHRVARPDQGIERGARLHLPLQKIHLPGEQPAIGS
jgi:hypothetical protein